MKWAPVARQQPMPALPVFDPAWKTPCLSCAHLKLADPQMRCRLGPKVHAGAHYDFAWCIDVRSDDGACGPDATAFVPKETTP
jgi:hypothetical protein